MDSIAPILVTPPKTTNTANEEKGIDSRYSSSRRSAYEIRSGIESFLKRRGGTIYEIQKSFDPLVCRAVVERHLRWLDSVGAVRKEERLYGKKKIKVFFWINR